MKRQWDIEELIEHFTIVDEDRKVLEHKTGATLLGCALLLKCFEHEARFPSAKQEIPRAVVDYVARQLKLNASLFADYDWDGRTIKLHRTQIREHLKFREATAEDSEKMASWLISTHLATDQNLDHLRAKILARFREQHIEPPTADRIERLIRSACMTYEQTLFQAVFGRLAPETRLQLDHLLERNEQVEDEEEQNAPISRRYGRSGDFATNRLDEQELAALSLHLLRICLVYVNTLFIQQVLADPKHFQKMKKEDFRALTPLIYSHVTPYGTFRLDLSERIPIEEVLSA